MSPTNSSLEPPRKRRRVDVQELNPQCSFEPTPLLPPAIQSPEYHAKLLISNTEHTVEEILIGLDRPITIGRHHSCTYVVKNPIVSNVHFSVHAVRSASGGLFLSCQDMSTNGTYWNGHRIRKSAIIVADGDVLQIPQAQAFHVRIRNKFETNIQFSQQMPDEHYQKAAKLRYQNLGNFVISNQSLGDGSFGKVRLAIDPVNYRQVACKTIWTSPQAGHNASKSNVQKEIDILRGLNHPNVNKISDVFYEDDKQLVHIFLDLCTGGDLLQFIEDRGLLRDGEAKYIGFQLLKALDYLHSRNISHRDLKPENVLLQAPGAYPRIMLADFGFARDRSYERTRSICGTMSYISPEALNVFFRCPPGTHNAGYSGPALDCWSLGVCLYFMISGSHPFDYQSNAADAPGPSTYTSQPLPRYAAIPPFSTPQTSAIAPNDQAPRRSYVSDSSRSSSSAAGGGGGGPAPLKRSLSNGSTSSETVIKNRILSGPASFDWVGWDDNPDAENLVYRLLDPDPARRATVRQAKSSPWMMKDATALEKLYKKRIDTS